MQAFISFFGHLFAGIFLALHALGGLLSAHSYVVVTPPPVATSTKPVVAQSPTTKTVVGKAGKTATTTTTTPVKKLPVSKPGAVRLVASTTPPIAPPVPLVPVLPLSTVNEDTRLSVVNILCTTKSGGYLYPISGSGVMVSGSGVVLTNAHVGQYFLLRDYIVPGNVDCLIRTGSPAMEKYHAELLYLPPAWINANASQITAQEGMGTGENDYAFLRITSSTNPSASLPATFPFISLTLDEPQKSEPVLLAGYPAGFLDGITIEMNLFVTTAFSTVEEIFAFNTDGNADLMSVGGTIVSQAGSSGGAIVRAQDGALQGIVATATTGATTATRDLRGITLTHIDRSLRGAGQGGIVHLLSGDLSKKALDFQTNTAPGEEQKLINALKK